MTPQEQQAEYEEAVNTYAKLVADRADLGAIFEARARACALGKAMNERLAAMAAELLP